MTSTRIVLPFATVAIVALAITASSASAEDLVTELGILDLTLNEGINPTTDEPWAVGDTYRLIFATSMGTEATSTDIEFYNTFVQNAANASALGLGSVTWKALASTETVAARDNTSTNGTENGTGESFWLVNGTSLVADNYADLYGFQTHTTRINKSETGGTPFDGGSYTSVWTGSDGAGGIKANNELGDDDGTSLTGLWNFISGAHWIERFSIDNTTIFGMYGVSEVLTVAGDTLVGDANGDEVVDAADYILVKQNMGTSGHADNTNGDLDGNGTVDWEDLQKLMIGMNSGTGETQTVPEPATLFIMLAAGLPALLKRRRSRG